jgi:lipopolysaccharide transport system ATP-binding protein
MLADAAIRAIELGKKYRLGESAGGRRSLSSVLLSTVRSRRGVGRRSPSEVWALRDLNVEVCEGRAVGLIGENGAGKSTFLKVLSKVTLPTLGRVEIRGRVGALLEIGLGFNLDFTGRENVYLNAAAIGMSIRETRAKFDDIVEFADVGDFIDTPMKRYSSGMYLRLAFSVAAHVEPDILLLDEVLAVGDAGFQRQCFGRVEVLLKAGRTVILVSHNLATIEAICDDVIVLHRGRLLYSGPAKEGIDRYREESAQWDTHVSLAERSDRSGDGRLRMIAADVLSDKGERSPAVCGADVVLRIDYESVGRADLSQLEVDIDIESERGLRVSRLSNVVAGQEFPRAPGAGSATCRIQDLPLMPGRYLLNIRCTVGGLLADEVKGALPLEVVAGDFYGSGILPSRGDGDIVMLRTDWAVCGRND